MELGLTNSPTESAAIRLEITPVQRVKFDWWLFERDIDNVTAARMFGAHPLTISRWRKRFNDDSRRVPPRRKIPEIEAKTGGDVSLLDWHRPCAVTYVEEGRAISVAAE